jgi:hypothetical protein
MNRADNKNMAILVLQTYTFILFSLKNRQNDKLLVILVFKYINFIFKYIFEVSFVIK